MKKAWIGLVACALVGLLALRLAARHESEPTASRTQKASMNRAVEKAPVDAPQATRRLRLEGQVVDENLEPVGDAEVHILGGPQQAHCERDGSLAFTDLEAGRFEVFAAKGDFVSGEFEVAFDGKSEPLTLHMHLGAPVKARVIESIGGAPIAGAVADCGSPSLHRA